MGQQEMADAIRTLKQEIDPREEVFNLADPDDPEGEPWAQLVLLKGRHVKITIDL